MLGARISPQQQRPGRAAGKSFPGRTARPPARPSPHNLSLLRPKRARLRQREGALHFLAAAVSPYTIPFPLQASASVPLSPSCPTTRTSRIPAEARGPTQRTAIPPRNARFVSSRDMDPDVDRSTDGGQGRAKGHGTIARARRHLDVSGGTKCPRYEGALGMEGVVKPSQCYRIPRIPSL